MKTRRLDAPTSQWSRGLTTAALMVAFLACLLPRMSSFMAQGRFWAEEGSIFFGAIELSGIAGLAFIYNGHLELATNFTVWLATLVPVEFAPVVTTYGGLAQLCIPIALIAHYRKELGLGTLSAVALLGVVAGLPHMPEVLANATCLHFHMLLLVGVIAALPVNVVEGSFQRWFFRALLIWAGLAGIPPNFAGPVFLGLALYERSRERWVQFGLLAVTATLQGCLVAFHWESVAARNPQNVLLITWLAFEAQVIATPLFGVSVGARLSEVLKLVLRGDWNALMFALWLSAPVAAVVAFWWRRRVAAVWAVSALIVIATTLSVSLSLLQDKASLISSTAAARYFFAPSVLWYLIVARCASDCFGVAEPAQPTHSKALGVGLAAYLFAVTASCMLFRPPAYYSSGKPWQAAVREAEATGSRTVEIWPNGWKMDMPSKAP